MTVLVTSPTSRSLSRGLALAVLGAVLAWSSLATARTMPRDEIVRMVHDEAARHGRVPPELALAVAKVESNFDDEVVSSAGAIGVMQIMPATGAGEFGAHRDELFDAKTNIRIGIAFLHRLYEMYGHRWELALSHYNGGSLTGGPGSGAIPHSYTAGYVSKVIGEQARYRKSVLLASLRNPDEDAGMGGNPASSLRLASLAFRQDSPLLTETGSQRDYAHYLDLAERWRRISKGERLPAEGRTGVSARHAAGPAGGTIDYGANGHGASPAVLDLVAGALRLRKRFRSVLSASAAGG